MGIVLWNDRNFCSFTVLKKIDNFFFNSFEFSAEKQKKKGFVENMKCILKLISPKVPSLINRKIEFLDFFLKYYFWKHFWSNIAYAIFFLSFLLNPFKIRRHIILATLFLSFLLSYSFEAVVLNLFEVAEPLNHNHNYITEP